MSDEVATTAQDVFDISMAFIDEVNEATGATDTTDTREYKQRTLLILTALRGELYPYSDTYIQVAPGKRPVCAPITDFETPLDLDDVLCQSVLPYGLAAQLLLDENPDSASFFQQKYEELKIVLGKNIPSAFEAIEDVYGGIGHGDYSRW